MYIHDLTETECRTALTHSTLGRLACALNNQPYIVPINFASDGLHLYGFTTLGQKVEWMRANPLVCFEIDEQVSDIQWISIVVFGRYDELTDDSEHESERILAHELLQKRAMWWEPAYLSQSNRDQPHSLTPIFFRIVIDRITGHRWGYEVSNKSVQSSTKSGWVDRLLGRSKSDNG